MDKIPVIFNFVRMLEKKQITGHEKRALLYKSLSELWGIEKFNENQIYVDYCLETIIFISKTHLISNINKHAFIC